MRIDIYIYIYNVFAYKYMYISLLLLYQCYHRYIYYNENKFKLFHESIINESELNLSLA